MTFKYTDRKKMIGSSYIGTLLISYSKLVEIFGDANSGESEDKKVYKEWDLYFPSKKTYVSIYNYKNGPNYPKGKPIEDITSWSIGGSSIKSFTMLCEFLSEKAKLPIDYTIKIN